MALGEPGKNRRAIVLSVDDLVARVEHELFVVVPISSSRALGAASDGLARGRHRRRQPGDLPRRPIGRAHPDTMREVEQALAMILGIDRWSSV